MNLLTIEKLSKTYGERKIFDQTSFYLEEGEKIGLIGTNGTGKSTLLKLITGIVTPDEGIITVANHVVIQHLFQNPEFAENQTIMDYIMNGIPENESKWGIEAEARGMLYTFGLNDVEIKTVKLSGGQRKKIALIKTLLAPADILILDEPTNHLDNQMAQWLEEYLCSYKGALIMVTHDRYFLDSVSTRIVEIDQSKIYSYKTNYSGFVDLKIQREAMELSTDSKKANLLRNELKWVMRGAKARSTKQKARLDRFEELKNRKRPQVEETLEMSSISTRLGKTTVELENIFKAYGEKKLINDFSYIFLKKDRIGFIGENGCGKTTLMKMIQGEIQPDQGQIIKGITVKIGYYAQEISNIEGTISYMDPEINVIEYIRRTAEYVNSKDGMISASQMLEKFLFDVKKQYSLIRNLSGGEKRRLNLLRVLMEAPNVLILDEPTNDLDIQTLTILEDYLDAFDGIVIVVSHDRYFLDRVVNRIFSFEGNGIIKQYEGGYTDYSIVREFESKQEEIAPQKTEDKQLVKREHENKLKFTFNEQREFETIELDIEKIEIKIQELEELILKNATDFIKLNEYSIEKQKKEEELEDKMQRWEYLTELDEQIRNQ